MISLGLSLIDWIETFLVHGPGDIEGEPIELDDEFAAFIVRAYELDSVGTRRVKRAVISRSAAWPPIRSNGVAVGAAGASTSLTAFSRRRPVQALPLAGLAAR